MGLSVVLGVQIHDFTTARCFYTSNCKNTVPEVQKKYSKMEHEEVSLNQIDTHLNNYIENNTPIEPASDESVVAIQQQGKLLGGSFTLSKVDACNENELISYRVDKVAKFTILIREFAGEEIPETFNDIREQLNLTTPATADQTHAIFSRIKHHFESQEINADGNNLDFRNKFHLIAGKALTEHPEKYPPSDINVIFFECMAVGSEILYQAYCTDS